MSDSPATSKLILRLYIAGETPNSLEALSNLQNLLHGKAHDLEIVDVLLSPERALDDGVTVTPTLLRVSPEPSRIIIGSLSPQHVVLNILMAV